MAEAAGVNWVNAVGVGIIIGGTFALVFSERVARTTALLMGAVLTVLWGSARGFFPIDAALGSVSLPTLLLIVAMTVIANVLAAGGAFDYVRIAIAQWTGGRPRGLFVALSMTTFAFSTIADNLTVIVIMGPLALGLLGELGINPRPYIVAVLIASNTGGAATAIGDFPNLIIAHRGGISFLDFLRPFGMFWICLILQLAVLGFLLWQFRKDLSGADDFTARVAARLPVTLLGRRKQFAIRSRRAVVSGSAALVLALALFATGGWHGWSPVEIALLAALVALLGSGFEHDPLIDEVGLKNVMAFFGLFVLAGAAERTGVVQALAAVLVDLGGGDGRLVALLMLLPVAVTTALVDAGPTTAVFIPLVASLEVALAVPGHLLWWALSLGVLAGSSATILGATAGTVAAAQVDQWYRASDPSGTPRSGFVSFFSRSGVPAALLMLLLGGAFLVAGFKVWR